MVKAVIFDFDGVLADTFDKTLGICRELFGDVTLENFLDHHNGNVYKSSLMSFSQDDIDYYNREYLRRADASRFFPLLKEVRSLSKDYQLFIVSSNSEVSINKYLKLTEIEKCFKKVLGMETEKSKKKKFKMIFTDYKFSPSECLFITDTLGDLFESREVNIKSIAVTWGYHDKERLEMGHPDLIISDFSELLPAIIELDKKQKQI
jgi:phosphoglycolate phosphatase